MQSSKMFDEAQQTPHRVTQQLTGNEKLTIEIARRLSSGEITSVITCGRGSSGHACLYAKYLIETQLNIPVSVFSPVLASIYKTELAMQNTLFLVISQSGGSPDLVASAALAKRQGATVVAIVNIPNSPLAKLADFIVPMMAGEETSVAATKSFICSLTAIAQIIFTASSNTSALNHLSGLPDLMKLSWEENWDVALAAFAQSSSLYVLGRGFTLPIAEEAALKLKETCQLHAEAFSTAEVQHGPMSIIRDKFLTLAFAPQDAAGQGFDDALQSFIARGAKCVIVGRDVKNAVYVPCISSPSPQLTPILQLHSFYRFANALALKKGLNPDKPFFLNKVTKTT